MTVPEWMGSGYVLGLFTTIVFILSHLISMILTSDRVRHALTYLALFLGGAALLTSYHTALGTVGEVKAKLLMDRLTRAEEDIVREIATGENYLCNFKGVRSAFSPPNFDEIESMRNSACATFQALRTYATQDWQRGETKFSPPDVGLKLITDPVWRQSAERLETVVREHDAVVASLAEVKPSPWLFWAALEPFIISASWCLGLALMVPPRWWRKK